MIEDGVNSLTAREISQVLREAVFGRKHMRKTGPQSWDEMFVGLFVIDIEGWRITIFNDCDELDYCERCESPDGRVWCFDSGDRYGTDPIALLSTWEHGMLESLLRSL